MDMMEYLYSGFLEADANIKESPWLKFCEYDLKGGELGIADAMSIAAPNSIVVELEPGKYLVNVKLIRYGRDSRTAGVRIYSTKYVPEEGKQIGTIGIDIGQLSICDYRALNDFAQKNMEQFIKWIESVAFEWDENRRFAWRVKAAGRTSVIVVETGFGDGTYPIKTLVSAGKIVGVDIMFIPAGAKYPF